MRINIDEQHGLMPANYSSFYSGRKDKSQTVTQYESFIITCYYKKDCIVFTWQKKFTRINAKLTTRVITCIVVILFFVFGFQEKSKDNRKWYPQFIDVDHLIFFFFLLLLDHFHIILYVSNIQRGEFKIFLNWKRIQN